MTIIVTKTVIKPKSDKAQLFPLVDDKCTVSVDVKDGGDNINNIPKPIYRNICGISAIYFMYAAILLVTVLFSLYVCAYFASSDETAVTDFKGWAEIPMPQYQEDVNKFSETQRYVIPVDGHMNNFLSQIFKEYFEIDVSDESYEKIDVPEFNGMKGRFIHDFSVNYSAVIDPTTDRCFVLPLNRSAILPPKSLRDVITKMEKGYYDIDMSVVKQDYRAIMPAITDFSDLGQYIANECDGHSAYRLEKINREIFKRSVPGKSAVFTQYAGVKFQEMTISNINDVEDYEHKNQ